MSKHVSYKTAGVDIEKANTFVSSIQSLVKATEAGHSLIKRPGAFAGLYELNPLGFKNPVLVSSTDGVGTKLLLAQSFKKHDTVGIDLVAMNVNDILCMGAKPLFFLDYIACGKVNVKVLNSVVKGIAEGCRQAGCALTGGETAEMPGLYKQDEYDLAGFTVGIVEKDKIIDGATITEGDVVLGLPSSGIHSNGYSLVRKVLNGADQRKWAKELLAPTKIYVNDVYPLFEKVAVKGIAHITGGAYYEKLTKILPQGLSFVIKKGGWPIPKIFQKVQEKGKIKDTEMYRTFNMGIGLAIVVAAKDLNAASTNLKERGVSFYQIGYVEADSKRKIIFEE